MTLADKIDKFQENNPLSIVVVIPLLFLVTVCFMWDLPIISAIAFIITVLWVYPSWRYWLFGKETNSEEGEQ